MAVCYATAVGPKKGKSTWGVEIPQYNPLGTVGINGVRRVGRGYIVNFPHPMHFLPSSDERA
jgi:hypothetical protein